MKKEGEDEKRGRKARGSGEEREGREEIKEVRGMIQREIEKENEKEDANR